MPLKYISNVFKQVLLLHYENMNTSAVSTSVVPHSEQDIKINALPVKQPNISVQLLILHERPITVTPRWLLFYTTTNVLRKKFLLLQNMGVQFYNSHFLFILNAFIKAL